MRFWEVQHMVTSDGATKVSIDVGFATKEYVAQNIDAILAVAKEQLLALLAEE